MRGCSFCGVQEFRRALIKLCDRHLFLANSVEQAAIEMHMRLDQLMRRQRQSLRQRHVQETLVATQPKRYRLALPGDIAPRQRAAG